jgi:AcrR family transcriptional regulator
MGITERKFKEKQARINQIRTSAFLVFSKKGFEAATMDEIAEGAEISKATIYLYFKTKEDLFYELIRGKLNELSRKLIRIRKKDEDPEQIIRSITETTFNFYLKYPEVYRVIARFKASEAERLLAAEKVKHLKEIMMLNLQQVSLAIQKGIQTGILKPIDPKLGAVLFWNMFLGIIQYQENRLEPGRTDYRKSTLEAGVEYLLNGLKKQ